MKQNKKMRLSAIAAVLPIISASVFAVLSVCSCQNQPQGQSQDQDQPMTIKQVLEQRHSIRTYAEDKAVSEETVMDILWAANGVTREDGRRTAPSAINAQDIDLYVCTAEGVSKYIPQPASLKKITDKDIRPLFQAQNKFVMKAPLTILLISDQNKFGEPDAKGRYMRFGLIDAGIVSQNISLYCTAIGLGTVCCAPPMEAEEIQAALGLGEGHIPVLYHPVGHPVE